jgi:pSer/pThr/pTyr-binding forkhead associated (FHA) protein
VSPTPEGLLIEDLGSTNGTYLNQQRVVAPALAVVGDRLQLGGVVLEIC